jgi:hypothetical protein
MSEENPTGFPVSTIRTISETQRTVDRLMFLATRTLVTCARSSASVGFPVGLSPWDTRRLNDRHPLTTAQCLAALQSAERTLPSLDLTAVDRRDLPGGAKEQLRNLVSATRSTINSQLRSALAAGPDPSRAPAASVLTSQRSVPSTR